MNLQSIVDQQNLQAFGGINKNLEIIVSRSPVIKVALARELVLCNMTCSSEYLLLARRQNPLEHRI